MAKKVIILLFFTLIGIIYLNNLTRDIYAGDVGDLVTAAYVLGVAHPPGYPLFSLVGFLFSRLPLPLPVVSRVGLISVIAAFAGLIVYYRFCLERTKNLFISLLSTAILAFSYLYWLMTEIPEGLALNNFFTVIILYLSIQFYQKKRSKDLYWLMFFIGLSMTHQFFIATLFPAVFLIISKHLKFILQPKRLFSVILLLIIGWSVYVYVPLAASRNPPVNWDKAVNLNNFLHLIFRRDYGGIIAANDKVNLAVRLVNLNHYLKTISDNFSYQIIVVALLGLIAMFRSERRLAVGFLAAFIVSGALTIFITAGLIYTPVAWGIAERYYGQSAIVLMFVVPDGFLTIYRWLKTLFSRISYVYLILGYFLIIPILMIKYNYPKTNLSKTNIGRNLAESILKPLPQNSVLFIAGDNVIFSVWYHYFVEKYRQDVNLINPPGVGNNLYLDQELNRYYAQNRQINLNVLIPRTLEAIKKERRLFTSGIISPLPKGMVLAPYGLVFEIVEQTQLPKQSDYLKNVETIWKKIKITRRETLTPAEDNFLASEIPTIYARALVQTGIFVINHYKDYIAAGKFHRQAIWADNTYSLAYSGLAISLFESEKNCNDADYFINQAIWLLPNWKPYYQQRYYFAEKCKREERYLNQLKRDYYSKFHEPIDDILK